MKRPKKVVSSMSLVMYSGTITRNGIKFDIAPVNKIVRKYSDGSVEEIDNIRNVKRVTSREVGSLPAPKKDKRK